MDLFAVIGTFFGFGMVLLGMIMEGGNLAQIMQITAAFIVLGGTTGAVILSFPIGELSTALKLVKDIYFLMPPQIDPLIREIVEFSQKARKEGIVALEKLAKGASDPLLTMGLEAVADGADPSLVRGMMETQVAQMETYVHSGAKVWESYGGYAPTLGIIGAVMGLIQVMQNLNDPSKLGAGIAVAFVATIYGLFAANLIAIPYSTRLKFKYAKIFMAKEMIIEGVMAIQAGESPALIERKLRAYLLENNQQATTTKEG